MSSISKIFKNPGVSKKGVKATLGGTSSVDPNCAYILRLIYIRDRRLLTRNDIRGRLSIWSHFAAWCRGNAISSEELESLFTCRH